MEIASTNIYSKLDNVVGFRFILSLLENIRARNKNEGIYKYREQEWWIITWQKVLSTKRE